MRIYQAGPLFSEAEREWHKALKARLLTAGHEVIWPGDLITQEEIAEWGDEAPVRILQRDLEGIISCKAVVALLDGPQVDDGTAFEIGYAYAKGIPVFGVRTDFRVCGDTPKGSLNAMIEDRGKPQGARPLAHRTFRHAHDERGSVLSRLPPPTFFTAGRTPFRPAFLFLRSGRRNFQEKRTTRLFYSDG